MNKTGLADSPLFLNPQNTSTPVNPPSEKTSSMKKLRKTGCQTEKSKAATQPINHDTTTPRNDGTTVAWYHDTMIELVRKAVKDFGKEAATHRFTVEEKKAIADIVYTYKNQNLRTSENEITRIAVNFVIEDYRENGQNSILEKVLKALNK